MKNYNKNGIRTYVFMIVYKKNFRQKLKFQL